MRRYATHGKSNTSEYATYHAAKNRCQNPKDNRFADYGGRGIEFKFDSFIQFYTLLGPRPKGLLLERINNDGHYEPGNVCWATRSQQQRNQRRPRKPAAPWTEEQRRARSLQVRTRYQSQEEREKTGAASKAAWAKIPADKRRNRIRRKGLARWGLSL